MGAYPCSWACKPLTVVGNLRLHFSATIWLDGLRGNVIIADLIRAAVITICSSLSDLPRGSHPSRRCQVYRKYRVINSAVSASKPTTSLYIFPPAILLVFSQFIQPLTLCHLRLTWERFSVYFSTISMILLATTFYTVWLESSKVKIPAKFHGSSWMLELILKPHHTLYKNNNIVSWVTEAQILSQPTLIETRYVSSVYLMHFCDLKARIYVGNFIRLLKAMVAVVVLCNIFHLCAISGLSCHQSVTLSRASHFFSS